MLHAVDIEMLPEIKKQKSLRRRIQARDFSIHSGGNFFVLRATEPEAEELDDKIGELHVRTVDQVLLGNAVQSRLHRASRNFEWLEKESADGHGDGNRHQQHLNIFAQAGV